MTEVPPHTVQKERYELNTKLNRLLTGVRAVKLDGSTIEEIRKASYVLNSLGMQSRGAKHFFDYQVRRLLLPTVDVYRRAWAIAWTNLRREERARTESYEFTNYEESSVTFG